MYIIKNGTNEKEKIYIAKYSKKQLTRKVNDMPIIADPATITVRSAKPLRSQ